MKFLWITIFVCGLNIAQADECIAKGPQRGGSLRLDASEPEKAIILNSSLLRLKHDELLFHGNTNGCYGLATNFVANCLAISREQSIQMAPSIHLAEIQTINHFSSGVFRFQMDRQTLLQISSLIGRIKDYYADEGTLARYVFKNNPSEEKNGQTSQDEEEMDLWRLFQAVNDTVISLRHLILPFLTKETEKQLNETVQSMSELSKEDLFADELFMESIRSQLSTIHRQKILENAAIQLERSKKESIQALENSLSNERASASNTIDSPPNCLPSLKAEDSHGL